MMPNDIRAAASAPLAMMRLGVVAVLTVLPSPDVKDQAPRTALVAARGVPPQLPPPRAPDPERVKRCLVAGNAALESAARSPWRAMNVVMNRISSLLLRRTISPSREYRRPVVGIDDSACESAHGNAIQR